MPRRGGTGRGGGIIPLRGPLAPPRAPTPPLKLAARRRTAPARPRIHIRPRRCGPSSGRRRSNPGRPAAGGGCWGGPWLWHEQGGGRAMRRGMFPPLPLPNGPWHRGRGRQCRGRRRQSGGCCTTAGCRWGADGGRRVRPRRYTREGRRGEGCGRAAWGGRRGRRGGRRRRGGSNAGIVGPIPPRLAPPLPRVSPGLSRADGAVASALGVDGGGAARPRPPPSRWDGGQRRHNRECADGRGSAAAVAAGGGIAPAGRLVVGMFGGR